MRVYNVVCDNCEKVKSDDEGAWLELTAWGVLPDRVEFCSLKCLKQWARKQLKQAKERDQRA